MKFLKTYLFWNFCILNVVMSSTSKQALSITIFVFIWTMDHGVAKSNQLISKWNKNLETLR